MKNYNLDINDAACRDGKFDRELAEQIAEKYNVTVAEALSDIVWLRQAYAGF
jgi:hypothetical protein